MRERNLFYRQVGARIRDKRKERGLSQEALAKTIGLKRPSISNIEKGRQNLLLHTFYDIVETLGSDANSILAEDTNAHAIQIPDLNSLPEDVRGFVEAGIKTAKKQV